MQVLGLDHLVINVADLDRSPAFYGEVLGMEVLRLDQVSRGEAGFVSVRASTGSIIDLRPSGPRSHGQENVDHFCLVVDSPDMEALRKELLSRGVDVHGTASTRWGARGTGMAFTISDPDGNKIELKSYGQPGSPAVLDDLKIEKWLRWKTTRSWGPGSWCRTPAPTRTAMW